MREKLLLAENKRLCICFDRYNGSSMKNATNDEARRLAAAALLVVKDAAAATSGKGKVEASTIFFLLLPYLFHVIWLHIYHFSYQYKMRILVY